MNILQTEWWTIGVPPEWWAEQEEDIIVIGDRDEVGCIEITTLCRDQGDFGRTEVEEIARANAESDWTWQAASLGAFDGIGCSYQEEEDAVREWYLANGPVLLFVTYSCELENQDLDEAVVNEILQTLEASSADD